MRLLRLKDNSQYEKEALSGIEKLKGKIADKTLTQLENEGVFVFPEAVSEAEDITQDQMIIHSAGSSYCTGNVMGFIGCGEERLIVESRFGGERNFFFYYILERVLNIPNVVDLGSDLNQDSGIYNFLLFLFPYYLKRAVRKGIFREYIRRHYNDEKVRGIFDIPRHIAKNTPFTGRIACSQRELSYNNSLMQLVRNTLEFIKRKPCGNRLLSKVRDEVKLVIDATPGFDSYNKKRIIEENRKKPVRHAYFREYSALQRLCLLILRQQKHQIGSGSKQIFGIVFDGAWLWEEYINSLVEEGFYHPANKRQEGAQRLFSGNDGGRIYPDFISRNCGARIIADAKYKPIENIGNRDYLQMLAYMFRFDAKTGYFFYPEKGELCDKHYRLNRGSTYEDNVEPRDDISIFKHGLKIPNEPMDYVEFVTEMKNSEKEFLSPFTV